MTYAERTLNDIAKERQLGDFHLYDPRIAELDAVWKKCGGDSFEYGCAAAVLGGQEITGNRIETIAEGNNSPYLWLKE